MAIITPNVGLEKQEAKDLVSRTMFNNNMDILDTEITGIKANGTTVQVDLNTVNQRITDLQDDINGISEDMNSKIVVPHGGTTGQVLAKKSNADGDIQWQNSAGIQGTFGGEFSTKADLLAYSTPQVGFNYVVTVDEDYGGSRTYYTYALGGIWQYMGSFSDGSISAGDGGGGGYSRQWTSPSDLVANDTKVLAIPYTSSFVVAQPTVLKFESGQTNIIQIANEFDNGQSSSFAFNAQFVEFVGTGSGSGSQMHLITHYQYPFTVDSSWTQQGKYSEVEFDASIFKAVSNIYPWII